MSPEEQDAQAHILQRLEAERHDREDKDRTLLLGIVKAVLYAKPHSLPEGVRSARSKFIVSRFEQGELAK